MAVVSMVGMATLLLPEARSAGMSQKVMAEAFIVTKVRLRFPTRPSLVTRPITVVVESSTMKVI